MGENQFPHSRYEAHTSTAYPCTNYAIMAAEEWEEIQEVSGAWVAFWVEV